jgi:serine/threonine-protein kinase
MVLIPAGVFLMGSDPQKDEHAQDAEQPQHRLYLPDYRIAKTPVTNTQYLAFTLGSEHPPPEHWEGGKPPPGKEEHPVVNVSWHDARAYCRWMARITGKPYSLPSEAEWEKGARGPSGRIYPWGDQWDSSRCNAGKSLAGDTTPVGAFPQGASPFGLLDMAGNVWEWTRSLWGKGPRNLQFRYLYDPADGRENLDATEAMFRVVRGGSFLVARDRARCAYRYGYFVGTRLDSFGFRVCVMSG